jgi:hypothetical protein
VADRWNELYVELTASEAGRIEAARRQKSAQQDRAELLRWSRTACRAILEKAREIALARAAELRLRAGLVVNVQGPEWSTLRHPTDPADCPSAEIGSIRLTCRDDEIVLYTHHTPGRLPTLHFLMRSQRSWPQRERNPRLVTIPGCRITRGQDGEPLLRVVDRHGASTVSTPTEVDDVVFRGFELLLRRGTVPASLRLPAPEAAVVARGAETPVWGAPRRPL